jgi:hypothetical protein
LNFSPGLHRLDLAQPKVQGPAAALLGSPLAGAVDGDAIGDAPEIGAKVARGNAPAGFGLEHAQEGVL